ncbi:MAG: FAD-binding protein [Chloroflexi bacterium]|nr:FAD-binding protein [Chloroflexota bacterium]
MTAAHTSDSTTGSTAASGTRSDLIDEFERIVGPDGVLWRPYDLMLYEYDGSIDKARAEAVVFPRGALDVSAIVRLCNRRGVPYTARGAGTGLSGGAIPSQGGVLISFARMNRILEIDEENLRAVVEPGLVNLRLSQAVAHLDLLYVPDPSSQKACTIGGNIGENSGGPHTLRYGVTTNHTLALEVVLPNGEIVETGGKALDYPGYDLTGLFVGSEGTLGIVTKITCRLVPMAETVKTLLVVFPTVAAASHAVSGIIARRIVPAALEMMDNLCIQAVESRARVGFPLDAEAVLIVEVEGLAEEIETVAEEIAAVCRGYDALNVKVAQDDAERGRLWAARKGAFGAIGAITPDYYTVDGVVPRSKLPAVLAEIGEISKRSGLRIANVFHAGDGNLHPLVLFDADRPGETERTVEAGAEIMRLCAESGGSLSGEHGIGMEKKDLMPLIFSENDVEIMQRVKRALDPRGTCNPDKVFPTPGRCLEMFGRKGTAVGW